MSGGMSGSGYRESSYGYGEPSMSREELKEAVRFATAITENKLSVYQPYEKQKEFHNNGKHFRERGLLAANQVGKTTTAGMEFATHTTGRYPDWWDGKRFDGPVRLWAAGTSSEGTRDSVQRILLGAGLVHGTGTIPKSCILDVKKARGTPNAISQIFIKHETGGTSYIAFRNYKQDVEDWAGESLNGVWFDEEPPKKLYTEGLTRTNARQGFTIATLTPLLGMTEVVEKFYPIPTTFSRALTQMTLDDVDHFTENEKEEIYASYEPYEREARMHGIPMLGEGRVFPSTMSAISCDAFPIPGHWALLGGIDFGWGGHPTGCVAIAWDRDADVIYVTHAYKERERMPSQMAVELRGWNTGMPWAWPHDGNKIGDRESQQTEAMMYRKQNLRMLPKHATFEDGGHGFEAGLKEMRERMETGRLKVFRHLQPWFNEFNVYHRKDGLVVKEKDDLLSATRVCVMAKRYAKPGGAVATATSRVYGDYDPLAYQRSA